MARDYIADVNGIINQTWNTSDGKVIPTTESMALAGGAKRIDATFLYADLANSSKIAKQLDRRIAAKIIKSFLQCCTSLVEYRGGRVISFDGDRILGVFMGNAKNTSAAICALNIDYVVCEVIKPTFEKRYDAVKNAGFKIAHGVGVDTGEVLVVRGGVRGNNDLISIGRAPNLAAKLSDIRVHPFCSFITSTVYNRMHESAKVSQSNGSNMWERCSWKFLDEDLSVYRSSWWRRP